MSTPKQKVNRWRASVFMIFLGLMPYFFFQSSPAVAQFDCTTAFAQVDSFYSLQRWPAVWGTGQQFLENCATMDSSWLMFGILNRTFPNLQNYHGSQYRMMLLRTLLNDSTDKTNNYYCDDVLSIVPTYQEDSGRGLYNDFLDLNKAVTLIDYLLRTSDCPGDSAFLWSWRAQYRTTQLRIWHHSVSGTTEVDTVDESMDSAGLGALIRARASVDSPRSPRTQNVISFGSSASPFARSTSLLFEVAGSEVLKVELFDILGREIGEPVALGVFAAGQHSVKIRGDDLPTGTIYARLTTAKGEVRTLKLLKLR